MELYLKFKYFHSEKMRLNMSSAKWRLFCPGGWGGGHVVCEMAAILSRGGGEGVWGGGGGGGGGSW